MKKYLFLIALSFSWVVVNAQVDSTKVDTAIVKPEPRKPVARPVKPRADSSRLRTSLPRRDSVAAAQDSLNKDSLANDTAQTLQADSSGIAAKPTNIKKPLDTFYLKLLNNPYLKTNGKPLYFVVSERQRNSKDEVFYILCGLLLCLAFIRLGFSRYFTDVFRLFFEPSFRQKQTREQLSQGSFPSLLLNLFFILSCGTYISFLLVHYRLAEQNFWWIFLYSITALTVLYIGKFLLLTLSGWIFGVKEATETYLFAVYLINKLLGVMLVPFILVIAFSTFEMARVAIVVSALVICSLFVYRYIISFVPVRREVNVSLLHFLFFVCAFEITPLLLIYKTLVLYLDKSL